MMIDQVIADSGPFFFIFAIMVIGFAEIYNIFNVNTKQYQRLSSLIGHIMSTFRSAMGDLSIIDSTQTFDLYEMDQFDNKIYNQSSLIVNFTFVFFCIAQFILLMIFMNFIIAVISGSYRKINSNKECYDYIQRVTSIYERELRFNDKDFRNNIYYPKLLVVQKKRLQKTDEFVNRK